jgi:hypothetical protein
MAYEDMGHFVSGMVNALRTFQDTFRYLEAEMMGMAYGTAGHLGEIRSNQPIKDISVERNTLCGFT